MSQVCQRSRRRQTRRDERGGIDEHGNHAAGPDRGAGSKRPTEWRDRDRLTTIPYEEVELGPLGYVVHVVTTTPRARRRTVLPSRARPSRSRRRRRTISRTRPSRQNAYALVMQTLHRFNSGSDVAWRGAPVARSLRGPPRLRAGNAYYSEDSEALVFGTSARRTRRPSACRTTSSSTTTHALLDGLRRVHESVIAGPGGAHEGPADIVALLSVFASGDPDPVRGRSWPLTEPPNKPRPASWNATRSPRAAHGDRPVRLADEPAMPEARVNALRRRVDCRAGPARSIRPEEPHRRGEVPVAAVLNAPVDAGRAGGRPEPGDQHVSRDRVAEEGATIAEVPTMAIRAIDYTPPNT